MYHIWLFNISRDGSNGKVAIGEYRSCIRFEKGLCYLMLFDLMLSQEIFLRNFSKLHRHHQVV